MVLLSRREKRDDMVKKKKLTIVILALIVVLGCMLRLYQLSSIPAGLHFDEAQAGYNSFLLATTGKNISGQIWPLDIDSFGDYRPAMISYASLPLIRAFGLNEITTRLPSALFGIFLIVLTFLLARQVFKSDKIALLAAFLFSISPYSIIFSRSTTEAIIELSFEILALVFFLQFFKSKRIIYLILVYLFWLLGYFSYHISRLLTPLFGGAVIYFSLFEYKPPIKSLLKAILLILIFLLFPFVFFLKSPISQGRIDQVSVFSFPEVQRSIDELIREDGHDEALIARVFHNKLVGYFQDITWRHLTFFSPQTMLVSLNQPDRYFVPKVGAVTIFEYIGFIFALGAILYRKTRPIKILLIALLLIAPLPSALTFEAYPNFQRALFLIPLWQVVAAFGYLAFTKNLHISVYRNIFYVFSFIVVIFQFSYFLHQYLIHQTARVPYSRNSEMKSIATNIYDLENSGHKVAVSDHNGAYIYYLFYNKLKLSELKINKLGKYFQGDFSVGNIGFFESECLDTQAILTKQVDIAIFASGCYAPDWASPLVVFNRSDGSRAQAAYSLDTPFGPIYNDYFALTASNSGGINEDRLEMTRKEIAKSFTQKI